MPEMLSLTLNVNDETKVPTSKSFQIWRKGTSDEEAKGKNLFNGRQHQ